MSPAVVDLAAFVQDFRSSFPSPASDDALALQREAREDTMELVSGPDRNEVYRVSLDCGCEFRYEPDAPFPFDLQKREECADDSAEHLIDGRVRAREARITS